MNILLIHHNERPSQLHSGIQRGEGLRAEHLGLGLQEHGFKLHYLCRANWQKNWAQVIASTLKGNHFDAVILLQVADVHLLPPVDCSIILDLYAPRLLELAFEPDHEQSISLLAALGKVDLFLCTHPRQRWHWWGVLSLAGIDLREDPIILVPLAIETAPKPQKDEQTIFVGGGAVWPWQSPYQNLQKALEYLAEEKMGQIFWFLSPEQSEETFLYLHPLLTCIPWKHRIEYRQILQKADFALDLSPNSPERELSFGFRQMEYFGCHLPILSTNSNALSVSFPNGCLVDSDITNLLALSQDRVWLEKAQQDIKEAQSELSPKSITESLMNWLASPQKRTHQVSSLLIQAEEQQRQFQILEKQEILQYQLQVAKQELADKNELILTLNTEVRSSISSIERISIALEQVTSFKQDTAQVLGNNLHQKEQLLLQMQAKNSSLEADIAKKTAEIEEMGRLTTRLENDLHHARLEIDRLEKENKKRWRR